MMKKIIIVCALILVAANGCKMHKAIQETRTEKKKVVADSVVVKKDSAVAIKDTTAAHVKKDDEETETYEESNILITAPNSAEGIPVPGSLHIDTNKSTLNNLVYTNDTTPKTTLSISPDSAHKGMAKAVLHTPSGTQVFQGWSSISINTKKWSKTGKHLSDSSGHKVIDKITHNTFDSAGKKSVAKDTVSVKKKIDNTSVTKGINLNWIIPACVVIAFYFVMGFVKGWNPINWFKK